jgi:predicted SAM-dependent methyltransferase
MINGRKLEIGPGEDRIGDDWRTVDTTLRPGVVDVVCEWGTDRLPFDDEKFSLVYASHVLEHVPWHKTLFALADVHRVLAPGGVLEVHVPNFDVLADAVRSERCLDDHAEQGLNSELHWVAERLFHFGCCPQWHRACFNESHLRWCLVRTGFVSAAHQ